MMLNPIEQEFFNQEDECLRIRSVDSKLEPSFNLVTSSKFIKPAMPIKFKGIILCSLMQKRPSVTKMAFFKWYTKTQNKKHQQIIKTILTGQNRKMSKDCIFYRLKQFAKAKAYQQRERNQEIQVQSSSLPVINKQHRRQGQPLSSNQNYRPSKFKPGHNKKISGFSNSSQFNQTPIILAQQKNIIEKETFRSVHRVNTIASLKSIINEKVLKKKSYRKISAIENQLQNFHIENQERRQTNNSNSKKSIKVTSQVDFEDLFQNQEGLKTHQKIQKNFNTLKNRKSLKIIHTLKIVKQVSTVYLQSCILNKIRKRKTQVFNILKFINVQARNQLDNDYNNIERQLQLANQNFEKEEQLQQLADQVQQRVLQIQEIQDEMEAMNSRMTKAFLDILIARLTKIFNKRLYPRFIQLSALSISQMNILPEQSENSSCFLQETSGIYGKIAGTIICDYSDLNSVKKIIEDEQQNQITKKINGSDSFSNFD